VAPSPSLAGTEARWRPYAACAHTTPQTVSEPANPASRRAAKQLCAACPVAECCLWAALAAEQIVGYRYGIWGGTTPARRARIAAGLPPVGLTATYLAVVVSWSPPEPAVRPVGAAA
jgi:hypothetical protein